MPTDTFLHLPEVKKDKFIHNALKIFAVSDYDSASITQIVKNLGIAKGSVYQYFHNKKDLYMYLVEIATNQKQQYIATIFKQEYPNFFVLYEQIYWASTHFDLQNPLYGYFLYQVSQERNSDELGNLHLLALQRSMAYFQKLLVKEQNDGDIRDDLPVELLGFWIVQTGAGILDYLTVKYQIDWKWAIQEEKSIIKITESELRSVIRDWVYLLRSGLQSVTKKA